MTTTNAQHKRLLTAGQLTERHHGRNILAPGMTEPLILTGIVGGPGDQVTLVGVLGHRRAIFPLTADAEVEVWKAERWCER